MAWVSDAVKAKVAAKELKDPMYFVINKTEVKRRIAELKAAFPKTALHAFACKANPLLPVLQLVGEQGIGCEAASICEFELARRAFPKHMVVFDSPCKTLEEIELAVYNDGGYMNCDNFQEIERVAELHAKKPVTANIGVRINAQIGGGTIAALSTGTGHSKFGTGLNDWRKELAEAYNKHEFLNMVHIHSGSQGLDFATIHKGIRAIVDFAKNDVKGGFDKVKIVDIGGGLSINLKGDDVTPTFTQYAEELKKLVPEIFEENAPFRIITEFGRALLMKAGIYISRIEYTKMTGGRPIILQHVGADLMMRTCWQPENFVFRMDIYNADGTPSTSDKVTTDVAGACCFAGDLIARDRDLAAGAKPGDYIAIKDVGAYNHCMYNYYNARQSPASLFFDEETKQLTMFRRADTIQDTMSFFDKPPQ